MPTYKGRCWCGALTLSLTSRKSPRALPLRACNCSFCRKHGARNTSDPDGRVAIRVRDRRKLSRFDFRSAAGGRLICSHCGCYIAIAYRIEGRWYASVNVNALENPSSFTQRVEPVDYGGETAAAKRLRRQTRWTPARLL
jgi:hypothetical protein